MILSDRGILHTPSSSILYSILSNSPPLSPPLTTFLINILTPPTLFVLPFSLSHCRCVVAITELWQDSAESLLHQWFPWLVFEDYTILRTEILIGEGGNKAAFLRDELVQVE